MLHQLYFLPPTITFTIRLSPLRSLRMWTSTAVPIDLFARESDAMGFWTPWKHIKDMWKSHVFSSNLRIYDGFSTFFHILVYKRVNMKNEESTMKNWELKQQMLVINGLIERETDTVNLWIYYQLLSFLTYFLSATNSGMMIINTPVQSWRDKTLLS